MTDIDALMHRRDGGNSSVLDALVGTPSSGATKTVFTSLLHAKSNHTFKIRTDTEYYKALRESVRENGVQTPLLVRRHPTIPNDYEIISGHTRWTIAQELGIQQLPVVVLNINDSDADILMAESNFQRPGWLPSERAHTYAVWLNAIQRKGGIEAPGEPRKGKSVDQVGESRGIDGETIRRYLKLNDLISVMLDYTDADRITIKAAYQLAFLCKEDQKLIADVLEANPGLIIKESVAKTLREMAEKDFLTQRDVREALGLTGKKPRPKTVSFSIPEDAFEDAKVAKKYKRDAAFQTALAKFIRRYIAEGGADHADF